MLAHAAGEDPSAGLLSVQHRPLKRALTKRQSMEFRDNGLSEVKENFGTGIAVGGNNSGGFGGGANSGGAVINQGLVSPTNNSKPTVRDKLGTTLLYFGDNFSSFKTNQTSGRSLPKPIPDPIDSTRRNSSSRIHTDNYMITSPNFGHKHAATTNRSFFGPNRLLSIPLADGFHSPAKHLNSRHGEDSFALSFQKRSQTEPDCFSAPSIISAFKSPRLHKNRVVEDSEPILTKEKSFASFPKLNTIKTGSKASEPLSSFLIHNKVQTQTYLDTVETQRKDALTELTQKHKQFKMKVQNTKSKTKIQKNAFFDIVPKFLITQSKLQNSIFNVSKQSPEPTQASNDNERESVPKQDGSASRANSPKGGDRPTSPENGDQAQGQVLAKASDFTLDPKSSEVGEFYLLDVTPVSSRLANPSSSREGFGMALLRNVLSVPSEIAVFGGMGGTALSTLDSYHIGKKNWNIMSLKPDKDFALVSMCVYGHTLDVIPGSKKLLLFGGYTFTDSQVKNISSELYEIDAATGTLSRKLVKPDSRKPLPRSEHVSSIVHDCLVISGGRGEHGELRNDIWYINLKPEGDIWSILRVECASEYSEFEFLDYYHHTATTVPKSCIPASKYVNDILMFGGIDSESNLGGKVIRVRVDKSRKLAECSFLLTQGRSPAPRHSHAATFLALTGSLVIHGGRGPEDSFLEDLFILHLSTLQWMQVRTPKNSQPRAMHKMVCAKTHLFVFGGYNEEGFMSTQMNQWEIKMKVSENGQVQKPQLRFKSLER